MIPAERSFVDFGKSKASSLIGVGNVGEVIVEVVEGGVSTGGGVVGGHCVDNEMTGGEKEISWRVMLLASA